jgi:thiazole synthase ThiGH ThiG subunit
MWKLSTIRAKAMELGADAVLVPAVVGNPRQWRKLYVS